MTVALLAAVAAVPAVAALLAAALRSPQHSGRIVTIALGLATAGSVVLLGLTAADSDGTVGGALLSIDRGLAVLLVVVLGTAAVVSSFADRQLDRDSRTVRFFALVALLAAGSVLVMVAADPVGVLVGWVGSGWALVALIGHAPMSRRVPEARRRIIRSLVVGDLALLAAVVIAAFHTDRLFVDPAAATVALDEQQLAGLPLLDVVAVLLVVAGLSRSAILPFHRWLVGTINAPTPVSAIVHAGFVSGAGIILVRVDSLFVASSVAVVLVFVTGVLTVVLASATSASRPDAKGALAWSTVAQMAFMVVQCAVGAFSSAIVHIAGHGMYKAARFLGAADTVANTVRAQRHPVGQPALAPAIRRVTSVVVATVAVAIGLWWFPPLLSDAGRILVAVFAWLTIASAVSGWCRRNPVRPAVSIAFGATGGVGLSLAYFASLRAVERFVKPAVDTAETVVDPAVLVATLIAVVTVAGLVRFLPGAAGERLRTVAGRLRIVWAEPRPTGVVRVTDRPVEQVRPDEVERATIRSEAADAAAVIAPLWPLSSFVAVNPLTGLESEGFEGATASARRWLRARTHLTLEDFRSDHARGLSRLADLEFAVHANLTEVCAQPPVEIEGRLVQPVDIVVADLLHGPELDEPTPPRTLLERAGLDGAAVVVDDLVTEWIAAHLYSSGHGERFVPSCLRRAANDPRLAAITSRTARGWIGGLDHEPAAVIGAAFAASGVEPHRRVDEMRGQLARLAGWAGIAKWRNEWAQPDERRPQLSPIEIIAVRSALEAAVWCSTDPRPTADLNHQETDERAGAELAARVGAVAEILAPGGRPRDRNAIETVLAAVPTAMRPSLWLHAQERCLDERFLTVLDRVDPGRRIDRPAAQAVFCIDVRSEGLRRHLEESGDVQTLGFAGFFGVPLSVRRLGWAQAEPRCPVLVAPSVPAVEQATHGSVEAIAAQLRRERGRGGLLAAHDAAKKELGAPFVLAEAAGWFLGPVAGVRTLAPGRAAPTPTRSTRIVLDESVLVEQRVFAAESVLRTMGLVERFAPIVLLCGHTSRTRNNAHATALECGACGGAAGDDNAMAVATLLNAPDVRIGLLERGIEIPDDTWFVAGLHETVSDFVTVLDADLVPPTHRVHVDRLVSELDRAGRANVASRARFLDGRPERVRDRGVDWAQVRPEWGLARAAAFVIGPRSLTAGLDLDGRAFLHEYDAALDDTGRVLETIMTAPLVVAHWISSQYYFSTVDPEAFGAGDKLMHNPIGSIGVVSGDGGDVRVGLPLQSTHVDGRRHHQPVRLLAVIQAELSRVEEIIGRHRILRTLVGGSWLRIAARSQPHEPWSIRTPTGTWTTTPRPFEADTTLATPDHVEMT